MATEPPISQLCNVCHTQPPKYRCPRCTSIRTCSLPCYKRHQSRASCNGQRIETQYVKRSQLATPAGFDHDYNFLTKIERAIQSPATKRGEDDGERPAKRRRKGAVGGLERYCNQHSINLERAPEGFQRAKLNATTFFQRSKKVCWTVEWIDERKEKTRSTVLENMTLEEAYRVKDKERKKKERQETETARNENNNNDKNAASEGFESTVDGGSPQDASKTDSNTASVQKTVASIDGEDTATTPETTSQVRKPALHFYLHVPRCLYQQPVVTALDGTATITECLRNRRVLEFPTVYVLPYPPESLPASFITEENYKERLRQEYKDVDVAQIVRSVGATVGGKGALDGGIFASQEDKLDEKAILEMLRRDIQA